MSYLWEDAYKSLFLQHCHNVAAPTTPTTTPMSALLYDSSFDSNTSDSGAEPAETTFSAPSNDNPTCNLVTAPIAEEKEKEKDLQSVSWDDVDVDESGVATGIFGRKWSSFKSKDLRLLCSRLGIRGVKNVKKSVMVGVLVESYKNKTIYNSLLESDDARKPAAAPNKEPQCSFRLCNVVFSDKFADRFATLGNVSGRAELDQGVAANDEWFWADVQTDFISDDDNNNYGKLQFTGEADDVMDMYGMEIDPSKIVQHDWKKLRKIWKQLNSDYKAALHRFTQSGTHDDNFFNFCYGKLDVYYLRKHLAIRPNLVGFVEATLPEEVQLSTDNPTNAASDRASDKSRSNEKRKRGRDEVADAIREFGNSTMRMELANKKLHYMEKDDARRERKDGFDTWERLQNNIRQLRADLRDPDLDDATREDINDDLKGVMKKKEELARELGLK